MNATRLPYSVIPSREEMRRMRHREECERAKRAESRAALLKVIAFAAATTLLVAVAFAVVYAHNRHVASLSDVLAMAEYEGSEVCR